MAATPSVTFKPTDVYHQYTDRPYAQAATPRMRSPSPPPVVRPLKLAAAKWQSPIQFPEPTARKFTTHLHHSLIFRGAKLTDREDVVKTKTADAVPQPVRDTTPQLQSRPCVSD